LARGLPVEFDRPLWIPLRAALQTLEESRASRQKLRELSSVVLPEGGDRKKDAQKRRLVWLRCQAAELLAEGRPEWAPLLACDPEKGRDFQLAQLKVLGAERIETGRHKLFMSRAESKDPVIAQAALRMIPAHPEIENAPQVLLAALKSEEPGTQATAGQVITAYPSRAHSGEEQSEKIVAQLKQLLEQGEDELPAETRAALIKAGGALGALSLKPLIEKACDGDIQALWQPSTQALALLGSPKRTCPKVMPTQVTKPARAEKVKLLIDSDVGELVLNVDGTDSPSSAARFLQLVDNGFYNGMAIHAVRAGFAVQFGDKDGDGYQDAASAPLPHEISPEPFSALSFGMSAFSPGSQDSQIFVVVSDAPQLTGTRVRLGKADGPWHLLTVGDVLHSVRRSP
jgi:cyclophilin family peptidyl-prolyl cis-trans isomerase